MLKTIAAGVIIGAAWQFFGLVKEIAAVEYTLDKQNDLLKQAEADRDFDRHVDGVSELFANPILT